MKTSSAILALLLLSGCAVLQRDVQTYHLNAWVGEPESKLLANTWFSHPDDVVDNSDGTRTYLFKRMNSWKALRSYTVKTSTGETATIYPSDAECWNFFTVKDGAVQEWRPVGECVTIEEMIPAEKRRDGLARMLPF